MTKELQKELKRIISITKIPEGEEYVFVCSRNLYQGEKKFDGFKMIFSRMLEDDLVYFVPTPYTK